MTAQSASPAPHWASPGSATGRWRRCSRLRRISIPDDAYWLLAEPVTLLVGQLDVRLGAVVDDLSADEAAALVATLNSHFAGDGLRFIALDPARWLIAATDVQQLVTHPADDAVGAPISPFLPDGPDAARWRRWQTEMQMLLFAHPVS